MHIKTSYMITSKILREIDIVYVQSMQEMQSLQQIIPCIHRTLSGKSTRRPVAAPQFIQFELQLSLYKLSGDEIANMNFLYDDIVHAHDAVHYKIQ